MGTGVPRPRPQYGGYRSDGFNRFANTPGASAPARAQQLSPTQTSAVAAVGTRPQVPGRTPTRLSVRVPAPANPFSQRPQTASAGAAASAALTGLSLYGNLQQGQGPFEASSGKGEQQIAVEIKTFGGPLSIADAQKSLGQYFIYLSVIKRVEPQRKLYLAIHEEVYDDFFTEPLGEILLSAYQVPILVFDPDQETIIRWID